MCVVCVCVCMCVCVCVSTAPAKLVMCDMLVGSVERIVESSRLLWLLDRTKLMRLVIRWRQPSYLVITQVRTSNGCFMHASWLCVSSYLELTNEA